MEPINQIAAGLGIKEEHLIPFGRYKAKISMEALNDAPSQERRGKLVVVTGMTPTPAGEGKTTTAIGLTQGMGRLGHRAVVNLREPSLGPIFGIKGGGTGGGKSRVVPEEEINIHFTGDAHAVSSAHNLLAALVDNAVYRNEASDMDATGIEWSRVTDASDRSLRNIVAGLGGSGNSPLRETRFDFVAASEIMAVLALSTGLEDLRSRISRIVVGTSRGGEPVSVEKLGVTGALMTLLRQAIVPNMVQTLEGQPAFVHTGPFGNIAHGCSSVVADQLGLAFADYVITEAGFGSDLGFEKFMHIKARQSGLLPSAVVLVASVRALRWHGGSTRRELNQPNIDAVVSGGANLAHHVGIVRSFGLPVVVAINNFDGDGADELKAAKETALEAGAIDAVECSGFANGGEGGVALAEAVVRAAAATGNDSPIQYAYPLDATVREKVLALAQGIYGADDVSWTADARRKLRYFESQGWGSLPICMAKTHLSISHDPTRRGSPSGYTFPISDIRVSVGAGFLYTMAGRIETLPGLPSRPRALDMDVTSSGEVTGLG
ncbi:MAG TPA: formate--tetrahydrofolate ligase [Dehalococcoidia bacterium]|nr:formate--tetrahydrofolate ligase [Chloroflexota bacterium]HIB10556.1 formate--tetrahydrofolate ligase [Dehalococcoidia bacterium]HIM48774.1 formate--tetrahydrofolate ligase [Dehalococcoidia bacterium]